MMSLTSEYALRAVVHIARNEEQWPLAGSDIAKAAGVPAKYLAKILGDLVRHGILEARRGRGGGFSLARDAREMRLWDVLEPFERFNRQTCPFGDHGCSTSSPCLAHAQWEKVIGAYHGFLRDTTIYEISVEQAGRKRAAPTASRKSPKKPKTVGR